MNDNFKAELNRFLDIGRKKGNVNEEDIYFRLMKYDATKDDITEIIENIEKNGIRIIKKNCSLEISNRAINLFLASAVLSDFLIIAITSSIF